MPALYSHPLYRLLHELSSPSAAAVHHESPCRRAFSPNFNVYETENAFVLEGELPGLSDKSQVHIEFTDAQILLVKGRIERSYRSSSPESKASDTESSEPSSPRSRNPTVEEEIDEANISPILAETRKKPEQQPVVEKTKIEKDTSPKYWILERTVGQFERRFTFTVGIDQDGVTASLEHGVLKIIVPRRAHPVGRRIEIL
ncbi:hypothetical protein RUND412_008687 [Rhizina undulata]